MLILGLVVLTAGAELLVRGASRLAIAVGISPLVVGLTVVAFGTSAPELVVSIQSTMSGQPDVALGNVVGSNIFNVLFILGISALIVPLRVSQQLIRFDVPLMVALSILVLIFAYDGRIGRLDGLLLTVGLISYTLWAIVKSRKEQAAIKAEYVAEFGVAEKKSSLASTLLNVILLVVGLGLLVLGSRWFVGSAVTIAEYFGVSKLVIGLTIVAAGTSLPEVATSIMAAIRGERDIAVGNVVGSNIFNIMGVLGISSLVSAEGVQVSEAAFQLDLPVMIAVAVACLPIFFTGHLIARWEGALFMTYYCAYTASIIIAATNPELTDTFAFVMFGLVIPLTIITLLTGVLRHIRKGSNNAEE
ncbi:calcium/sodium antiporter [Rubinisphaera sp.]|uniref:calcium/sodium antiporter n=1 Tax=Rubinisphaera sp. TaxID=2024857 RepID=UPI000C0E6043|nr:calcium/sodium antiporter [Rubinisphaera sp.]MBV07603.1 sodium:calcium antiporter [Rubinisphaera sp.]HCS55497.1 sodium:calcium antiporter [Planctomycetaceae bacterium]|tara:strand:+ start:1162 stop:2241 length:1080 start_codon:yes stop_codon:yes gene_type:complete